MEYKITDRQLMALLACYFGERINQRATGVYGAGHDKAGQPYWTSQTSMGGAVGRMADDLRNRGFVTEYNRYEDFGDKSSNDLTAKGYAALAERLGHLPTISNIYGEVVYQFEIDPAELENRRKARIDRESEMERIRAERLEESRERSRQNREKAARERLEKLRNLFREHGLADNWADAHLIEFADRVAAI